MEQRLNTEDKGYLRGKWIIQGWIFTGVVFIYIFPPERWKSKTNKQTNKKKLLKCALYNFSSKGRCWFTNVFFPLVLTGLEKIIVQVFIFHLTLFTEMKCKWSVAWLIPQLFLLLLFLSQSCLFCNCLPTARCSATIRRQGALKDVDIPEPIHPISQADSGSILGPIRELH